MTLLTKMSKGEHDGHGIVPVNCKSDSSICNYFTPNFTIFLFFFFLYFLLLLRSHVFIMPYITK